MAVIIMNPVPSQGESDADFAARMRAAAPKHRNFLKILIGLLFLLLVFMFFLLFYPVGVEKLKNELAAKDTKIAGLEGENKALKARPPEQIVAGLSTEQCLAKAEVMVKDAVKDQCQGKTVAGPIRYRDRPQVAKAPPQVPRRAPPTEVVDKGGNPDDRCIFRIRGEIKAETFVKNGAVNCPIWRDQMVQKYNQNPNDKIWERVYPTAKPL